MEISPTRSALLETRDERLVMGEGYRFLDEKRLLLASEIIKMAGRFQELQEGYLRAHQEASEAMRAAVTRHGLHGMQVAPARELAGAVVERSDRIFFGVPLVELPRLLPGEPLSPAFMALLPSQERRACRDTFARLLSQATELAALSGNLHRLLAEYQRTERRARALEDVILPELDEAIHEMDIRLEEMEQEEAVRVRLGRGGE
ncbi:MAG: V-type ATP synthase subunit D [Magnetococcales bacterium]|nr:V-type ATP synthase subunit D [Magnetococcales bacterium]